MTVVVDASVLVAALVGGGSDGTWAEAGVAQGRPIAPELAPAEVSNALRRLERLGELSPFEARTACRDLLQLSLRLYSFAPLAGRVWKLRANLTSYDAWYVALAESLGCPLLTLDRRLARTAGPRCEILVPS